MRFPVFAATVLALAACSSSRPPASPGTVTLRLLLPSGQAFCDVITNCSGPNHVFLGKESGNWLTPNPGPCGGIECSTACTPGPCNAGACQPGTITRPVTTVETTWDGSYVEWSTCGGGIRCYNPTFVPPGRYVARLCATPGALVDTSTCTQTAPEECVETTFDLPGPALVEVPLR